MSTGLRTAVRAHTANGQTEHMVYLELPAAGGDAMLVGVTDSKQLATEVARVFQRVIDCEKGWQRVISPDGKALRW